MPPPAHAGGGFRLGAVVSARRPGYAARGPLSTRTGSTTVGNPES